MNFPERESDGAGNFLKLKDKETVQGVFRGDPVLRYLHWPQGGSSSPCQGPGCAQCRAGDKAKFRFSINFITKDAGTYVAKVFEQGGKAYDDLKKLADSGYELDKHVVSISRTGSGQNDTKYTILPLPKGELNAQSLKLIAAVELNDLGGMPSPTSGLAKAMAGQPGPSEGDFNGYESQDQIPF